MKLNYDNDSPFGQWAPGAVSSLTNNARITKQGYLLPNTWDLFDDSMNTTKASKALDQALVKTYKAIEHGEDPVDAWDEIIEPVRDKYEDYGAVDTEPRVIGHAFVTKFYVDWINRLS